MIKQRNYYGADNEYRIEVGYDDIRNNWVARLFTFLDDGKEVFLDSVSDRTMNEALANGAIRIKECRRGMAHHGQISKA